jgi:hypothetical protein
VALVFPVYLVLNALLFGVPAEYRLPELEEIAQIEVWNSDSEKTRIETEIFTEDRDLTMVCNLLDALCDYDLIYMGVEDVPRFTAKMTLTDGSEYTITLGGESVNFNGTFKGLRNQDAAKILTEQLLG